MSGIEGEVRIVMLPWLAFGHMIPFLDLSIALARLGIRVYFISTPRNVQRLPKVPPQLSPLIEFVAFPLPNHGLPENAEATVDIPIHKMESLKMAYDLLRQPITNFIAEKTPNWILADFFPHWAADIAQDLNIPLITSILSSAVPFVFCMSPDDLAGQAQRQVKDLTIPPHWIDFPCQVAYMHHEAVVMHSVLFGVDATGFSSAERFIKLIKGSQAVALRSTMEYEGDYFELFSKVTGKPVFPMGFLPPQKLEGRSVMSEEPWSKIFDWLDKQQPRSVVFVGFGSECKLKKEEIEEIAYGLNLAGQPFLWALRRPDWANEDSETLPPGFKAERGVVQMGWAPQREILAHPSIGGSLFHAGWASIIETIVYGHNLILLPFVIFQPLDCRQLVGKGLAIEVERAEDGCFSRNNIAKSLQKAMASEEGEAMRRRVKQAADAMFRNEKLNDMYINKLAQYLKHK